MNPPPYLKRIMKHKAEKGRFVNQNNSLNFVYIEQKISITKQNICFF